MKCSFDFECSSDFEECCNGFCSSFCDIEPIANAAINISIGVIVAIVVGVLIVIGGCITACVCCCKYSQHGGVQGPRTVTTATTNITVAPQQHIPQSGPPPGYHGNQAYPMQQPMQNYPPQQGYPQQQPQVFPPQPAVQTASFQTPNPGYPTYSQQPPQGIEYTQPATNPNFKPPVDAPSYPGSVPNSEPPPYSP